MLKLIEEMLCRLIVRLAGSRPVSDADRVSHYAAANKLQPIPVKTDRCQTADHR